MVPGPETLFLIGYKTLTKCTVAFHLWKTTVDFVKKFEDEELVYSQWKATVDFVKKFEDEELVYMTAGTLFFILFSTNRDR